MSFQEFLENHGNSGPAATISKNSPHHLEASTLTAMCVDIRARARVQNRAGRHAYLLLWAACDVTVCCLLRRI